MKITGLEVDGFGVWRDLRIDGLSPGLNVLYGANEAGKTTLMQFVRTVLYGFSPARRQRYLPPLGEHRAGGTLVVSDQEETLLVTRECRFPHGDQDERCDVTGIDGVSRTPARLTRLLKGIDEPLFNSAFVLGLRDLQELGTLSDTRASELLFRIAGGLDRVSLFEVLNELEISRNRLLATDDRPSEIVHLLGQQERLRAEIHELAPLSEHYGMLVSEQAEVDAKIAAIETDKRGSAAQLARLETAQRLVSPWHSRSALDAQLASLASLPTLPLDTMEQLKLLAESKSSLRRRLAKIRPKRRELFVRARRFKLNESLWRDAQKATAFCDQQEWIAELERQLGGVSSEAAELRNQINAQWQRAGLSKTGTGGSQQLLSALKPAARTRSLRRKAMQAAEEKARQAREAIAALDQQVTGGLNGRDGQTLTSALDKAGSLVSLLRRRLQLDERADKMLRNQKELEEERHDLLEEQVMPGWIVSALCVTFAVGVAMLLGGLFLPKTITGTVGLWLALGGLLGNAAAAGMKVLLEHLNQRRLETCEKQLGRLQLQIKQGQEERDELDKQLPQGGGPLTQRIQVAERELAAIEELVPLDSRRQILQRECEASQKSAVQAKADYHTAQAGWQKALAAAGLPKDFSPKRLRWLSQSLREVRGLEERLEQRQQEHGHRLRAVTQFRDRLSPLLAIAGIPVDGKSIAELLTSLREVVLKQNASAEERDRLRDLHRRARRREAKTLRALRRNEVRRRRLLRTAQVGSEADLERLAGQHEHLRGLREERDALQANIVGLLAGQFSESEIGAEIEHYGLVQQFDQPIAVLRNSLATAESEIKRLAERRGELNSQRTTMVADRRLINKHLELNVAEERIKRAIERWQVLCVTHDLLAKLRREYEKERQPEALRLASIYFKRLTDGRYTRVWTPLGETMLRVDDQKGQSLPVEVLSRGTREQLYLALRLALVKNYSERGIDLPLVMDDLFVNFDADRLAASALLLRDFAESGHQVLIFTCHDHIQKLFRSLRVPVQVLGRAASSISFLPVADEPIEKQPVMPVAQFVEEPEPVLQPVERTMPERVDPPQRVTRPARKRVKAVRPAPEPPTTTVHEVREIRRSWDAQEFSGEFTERPVTAPPVGGKATVGSAEIRTGFWADQVTQPIEEITIVTTERRQLATPSLDDAADDSHDEHSATESGYEAA